MSENGGENPNDEKDGSTTDPYASPNPFGAPKNPYGAPSYDPYGAPPPQGGSDPYGQAPNPYAAPQFNPTSANPYATADQGPKKTDGMSIGALIASVIWCCGIGSIVGIILGVIGLGRTKDGKAGGRGMALAGIIVGIVGIVISVGGFVALVVVGVSQSVSPSNAKVGECVDITHDGNNVSMTKKSCTDAHDGEIVGVKTVSSDEVSEAANTGYCQKIIDPGDQLKIASNSDLKLHSVTENPDDVKAGDHVACYVEGSDKLTEDVLK